MARVLEFQRLETALKHQLPSTNAMNPEPWVTAIDVAKHLGVVKDTGYAI